MEDLNKNQIILLALLVSFVAAVATSIMTYSLLNEAPPTVTQTINRVVERTVETVVPQQSKPDVVTKEVTVVVKEEDLVIDSIAKNKSSLVRLWQSPSGLETEQQENIFLGIGLIIDKDGLIVANKISAEQNLEIEAILPNGTKVLLEQLPDFSEKFSAFKIEDLGETNLIEVVFGDSGLLQLGQSIISIEGISKNEVSTGRITGIEEVESGEGNTFVEFFESDMSEVLIGSPAINLRGEIIGISTGMGGVFEPVNTLKSDLELLTQI